MSVISGISNSCMYHYHVFLNDALSGLSSELFPFSPGFTRCLDIIALPGLFGFKNRELFTLKTNETEFRLKPVTKHNHTQSPNGATYQSEGCSPS